jgi:hypothetical protein
MIVEVFLVPAGDAHLDQPEPDGYSLVVPFVVCRSNGGPYDDESFVAGWQCGDIDRALAAAAAVGASRVRQPMVHAAIIKQLELVGMYRGFPTLQADAIEGCPEWADVTFVAGEVFE